MQVSEYHRRGPPGPDTSLFVTAKLREVLVSAHGLTGQAMQEGTPRLLLVKEQKKYNKN